MSEKLPADFLRNVSMAVGQLVVSWAFVEQVLDMCIAVVYQSLDCKYIGPEIPRSTKRKVEFLKTAIKTHRKLARFQTDLALLSSALTLADARHTVVHGVISEYDDKKGAITFVMLDAKPQIHHEMRRTVTFKSLLDAGGQCQSLTVSLHDLVKRLIKALVPKNKAKDLVRSLGS